VADKDVSGRVKLHSLKTLSDNHYVLRNADFDYRRNDGAWQHQIRESYDPGGDGAAVLPLDSRHGKLLLIRQFRWPAYEWGYRLTMIEAVAGKLDGDNPEQCAFKEAQEEAGITIANPQLINHCFISPGAVKERISLFLAEYDCTAPRSKGGGHEYEGEDIEVMEMTLDTAMMMIASGDIIDAKTIILLQAAKLRGY
jgi:nudix-type nucleoside diphosphatase (YffH/AdpP family)